MAKSFDSPIWGGRLDGSYTRGKSSKDTLTGALYMRDSFGVNRRAFKGYFDTLNPVSGAKEGFRFTSTDLSWLRPGGANYKGQATRLDLVLDSNGSRSLDSKDIVVSRLKINPKLIGFLEKSKAGSEFAYMYNYVDLTVFTTPFDKYASMWSADQVLASGDL